MTFEKANSAWSRGLQHASDLLIRRGTAMGPLVPILFLVPFFLVGAYFFRSNSFTSALLVLASIGIVFEYFRQYAKFAKSDPDRLQSEEYRYNMTKIQFIAGKDLATPVPLDELNLTHPSSNPANPMPSLEAVVFHKNDQDGGDA